MSLTISKETAKRLYSEAPSWFQEELKKEFGEKGLVPGKFTDIKSYHDACNELGLSIQQYQDNSEDDIAYKKLKVITKAINQGWEPDWDDINQKKWFPWFRLSSGFGFGGSDFSYADSLTDVGSRLCFETKEKSDYAGKQFTELYKSFLT